VCFCVCHQSFARVAVGVSWRLVIASAPWAARWFHTSVIDPAGAIYVIGGGGWGDYMYNDVWASTDGGDDRSSRGTIEVVRGSPGVLTGTRGVFRGTELLFSCYSGCLRYTRAL
jgi:hypothetical protein